ncbi:hypothetical protein H9I32_03295 [Bacillus sp. Xin]|uniref:hypothetical protein n=1 Tax=unclassified Bacillus (in: firmicutes) TaxID=185979 RepID=UPI001574780A|nr:MULTISPECIES: hypothetical protein [unclassified Bacillus (in: firmicutes)]MBC6971485.1 hypothetical protein [Bacillus sp. Xin]MCI0766506.1 hypothetical protein [Bacillus sp. TL12]NSW38568.1 hypothetical protein [Bacillus sp. Xin1]
MEEKHDQPMIKMENSSIVIVKNSASIIIGLFCLLLFFAKPFRKTKCPKCSKKGKKSRVKE